MTCHWSISSDCNAGGIDAGMRSSKIDSREVEFIVGQTTSAEFVIGKGEEKVETRMRFRRAEGR